MIGDMWKFKSITLGIVMDVIIAENLWLMASETWDTIEVVFHER